MGATGNCTNKSGAGALCTTTGAGGGGVAQAGEMAAKVLGGADGVRGHLEALQRAAFVVGRRSAREKPAPTARRLPAAGRFGFWRWTDANSIPLPISSDGPMTVGALALASETSV